MSENKIPAARALLLGHMNGEIQKMIWLMRDIGLEWKEIYSAILPVLRAQRNMRKTVPDKLIQTELILNVDDFWNYVSREEIKKLYEKTKRGRNRL